jgi:hypothetical protein
MNAPKRSASPATTLVVCRLSCRISLLKGCEQRIFREDLAVGADEWLAVRAEPVQVGSVHFSQGQPG